MIRLPSPVEVAAALARLHERGTVRHIKAKGTEECEAELRERQNHFKRLSRARRKSAA